VTTLLADPYYSQSNALFRTATNQTEVMLDRLADHARDRGRLTILSVGSGVGLFELPMLTRLGEEGITVARFVGVDPSAHANAVLGRKLADRYKALDFELVATDFETYDTEARFDMVLFNHVFEYLTGDPLAWVGKSLGLLADGGNVLVFSPNRGGINQIYQDVFAELVGAPPFFANDIEVMLDGSGIVFSMESMTASCEVSALQRTGEDPEKLMLLSFLTQRDCREVTPEVRERYIEYYLSLRQPGESSIPHPVTLFVM
jgi:SAM-dependent methyltransferase